MRAIISQTITAARPSANGPWFPGLPHAVAAASTWLVFGGPACLSGLLMASLVSFVVWLPLTALALNNGQPLAPDATPPVLTTTARLVLLLAWTATAWGAAAIAR